MDAQARYRLWVELLRGRLTEEQAADSYGLDVAAVRRLRRVAEQGALAALSTSDGGATAQVTTATEAPDAIRTRVRGLLGDNPVFFGVNDERIEALAGRATVVQLGPATPVTDRLAAGPLLVAEGTLLGLDGAGAPLDLVGAGSYRAPRAGRRLTPLGTSRVASLPDDAVENAGVVARGQLAARVPLGGVRSARVEPPSSSVGAVVLGDLVAGPVLRAGTRDRLREVRRRMDASVRTVVAEDPDGGALVIPAAAVIRSDGDVPLGELADRSRTGPRTPHLPRRTPLIDALAVLLSEGATTVAVTGSGGRPGRASVVGALTADELPVPGDPGLAPLLGRLATADSVEALAGVRPAVHELVRGLLVAGMDVADAGVLMAAATDGLIRRLLHLAGDALGPAPGDFAWLVFGSVARRELSPTSDQDTGLVHAATDDPDALDWYARLGTWMTDALESCGYPPCPGGVVAAEDAWRNDPDGWDRTVRRWTSSTETDQLVGADIGMDVRAVCGGGTLPAGETGRALSRMVVRAASGQLTIARLARAALSARPPSSLWGRVGANPLGPPGPLPTRHFDLKRHGLKPIIDLARVHTLARGGTEVATAARLSAAGRDGALSADLAATLVEGLRLYTWARLSAQFATTDGDPEDVDWGELPAPLRGQFSDTFRAVRTAQGALRSRYRLGSG